MSFIQGIDFALFHFINITMANPVMDVVSPAITDLNKTVGFRFILIPLIGLLMLWKWRWKGAYIFVGALVAIGAADFVGNLIKHWVERPRPFQAGIPDIQRSGAGGFSFPSNHSSNMFAMATYLSCFLKSLGWRLLLFGIAVLIAFSRVYNGVHFPGDVIGGGFLGALSGWSFARLISMIIEKISQRSAASTAEAENE
jgi:undecaprenyl-diphosphatase